MQAHPQSRQTCGNPRILRWLHERGHACGRHRIARLMRGAGLRQRPRRRFRISLTDSDHDLPVAPNRLMGQPPPEKADTIWVADITSVDTKEGWLYVAGGPDRHSRRCGGSCDGRHPGHKPAAGLPSHGAAPPSPAPWSRASLPAPSAFNPRWTSRTNSTNQPMPPCSLSIVHQNGARAVPPGRCKLGLSRRRPDLCAEQWSFSGIEGIGLWERSVG